MSDLVSIIMPAYNCAGFIQSAIASAQRQTYANWELWVVDDASTDGTADIACAMAREDARIHVLQNDRNLGAALTRNKAVQAAQGRYLAFLDSDDVWRPEKLERQVRWMQDNHHAFACTSYDKIDETGAPLKMTVRTPLRRDYHALLKNSPGNSTILYDASVIPKQTIPDIRKRNDYVMWLKVIRHTDALWGLDESLSCHRVRPQSISVKKTGLIKYHWKVYREFERLSLGYSAYLVIYWIVKSLLKPGRDARTWRKKHPNARDTAE